jgi:hypothetical protein
MIHNNMIKFARLIKRRGSLAIKWTQGKLNRGYCTICDGEVFFHQMGPWLRDQYLCLKCGSIPRNRALIKVLNDHFPGWRSLQIHESSPGGPSSNKIKSDCKNYIGSQFFANVPRGQLANGQRSEDLEALTFEDESFDLVVTQDVFEHVLRPARAFAEIARTLRPGGAHVYTVPYYRGKKTVVRTEPDGNDGIRHLRKPDYHGNPIDPTGSLVITEWGDELCDFVFRSSGMTTTIFNFYNPRLGLAGEFLDVLISRKPSAHNLMPETEDQGVAVKGSQDRDSSAPPEHPCSCERRDVVKHPTADILPNRAEGSQGDRKIGQDGAIRAIAFHLPQFHPIPENDEWWGKGFTEWINVVKARPRFAGHYQPHLPADLGFYDLRLPEARAAQAELAGSYGIHGFCYYHYWFHGRRLLERPVNETWKSGEPNFPFCLCWANENWTRRWDGQEREILLEQQYTPADDLAHIHSLIPMFQDRRYIRVMNRPLFLIYKASGMPEPERTIETWRREAERAGLNGLFLVRVESYTDLSGDPCGAGFDAALEFQPRSSLLWERIYRRKWWHIRRLGTHEPGLRENNVFDYETLVARALAAELPAYPRIPGVCPGWDNSPRLKHNAYILDNSTPEVYERWLRGVVDRQRALMTAGSNSDSAESLVFINAWNEWAEGNHLEPCQKWGRKYLEATQRVLEVPANQPVEHAQR